MLRAFGSSAFLVARRASLAAGVVAVGCSRNTCECDSKRYPEDLRKHWTSLTAEKGGGSIPASAAQHYHEVKLGGPSELFLQNSVILIPNLLSPEECRSLISAADKCGVHGHGQGSLENWWRAVKRSLYSSVQDEPTQRFRMCDLDIEAQELSAVILRERILPFMEREMPQVAQAVFGASAGLSSREFSFSPNEPAINRYTAGGAFESHTDKMSVTVNVLLSQKGAFSGGGTLFQPEAAATKDMILLQPCQGMGVIFNGSVVHAGKSVMSGTRHLYVASFCLESLAEASLHN
eukprot:TRINITY_DN29537_c0_g1_i1.p1 TRINITY_DN29537_c0_g1~~TRINITY_DN29537_c0_g1_i1.p1  ORF type:complete len:292 (-),score=38.95 TRINITY_DN29537_c0_g1_i1:205-1080(-)